MRLPRTVLFSLSLLFISIDGAFLPITAKKVTDDSVAENQAVLLTAEDDFSAELSFELQELSHELYEINNEQFDKYSIDGETIAGEEGWPELPCVSRYFLVPPQSGISLKIDNLRARIQQNANPFPRQPITDETKAAAAIGDWSEYNNGELYIASASQKYDGFHPPVPAKLGKPVIMRGYRIVPVIIYPLRWNPRTKEMQIIEAMDISLDFTSDENRINIIDNPNRRRPSASVDKMIAELVMNPPPPGRDDPHSGSLLYITPNRDDVVEALEPLVEWRRRMGWTVEVERVNNSGAAAIKRVIQDAYDEWDIPPEHIILVGDANGQYLLGYFDERRDYPNYPYETDHHFGCLEGDDILQEAAVGRFCYDSINMLNGYIDKTIQYESEPYLGEEDEVGWQKRAMVCSVDNRSRPTIPMCRWAKYLFLRNSYDNVEELYYPTNGEEASWIPREIESGVSFFVFRGHLHMNNYRPSSVILNLRNGGMLPFAIIATCNTGDYGEQVGQQFYHSEYFALNPNGGAIGAVGCSGATHTLWNNLITCATVRAPFVGISHQGWALVRGKVELFSNYADRGDLAHNSTHAENWLTHTHIFNLIGDPAVDLYTDVPRELDVDHAGTVRAGDTRFDVNVAYAGDDPVPAENVRVCLYKQDEFQLLASTNADGHVSFALNPEWTQDGEIQLTVTGHNLMPYLEEFEVAEVEKFLGTGDFVVDDDDDGESNGDGDETVNPGETIELSVEIVNYGSGVPEGEMLAVLTPALPNLEVSEDADTVGFDEAPASGESVTAEFVVEIGGGFPQEFNALFNLTIVTSDETWECLVSLPVEGPQIELASFAWEGDPVRRGGEADFSVSLVNPGERNSPPLAATMLCLTQSAEVGNEVRQIEDGIQVDGEGEPNGTFSVSARVYHLGGQRIDMVMLLSAEDGFQDSVFFSVNAAVSESNEPFGPDNYGYLCIDDTDTNWFDYPEFEWVEIDPSQDGHGTNTELSDNNREQDEVVVVDLPFNFQYYGEEFDEVTICTNGWMALGSYRDLTIAVNRRIPGGLVAPAMLCPFWDDLITRDGGLIFYWHDEENHRFIVEWSRMHKLGANNQMGGLNTFQVILFDPDYYPSFTGDSHIHFQYLEVDDTRPCDQIWDTPYATVGIGSPNMDDGLEYVYWNEYQPGAAELADGRCIRFTTMITFDTGCAEGMVTDARTGLGLPQAKITAFPGYSTVTNDTGYYFIDEVIADSLHKYTFTASKWGWNDSTLSEIEIVPEETTRVDFALLHPEFNLDEDDFWFGMNPDSEHERSFQLSNDGNGTLWFTSRFNYVLEDINAGRDDPDELWDPLLLWNATEVTEDTRLAGICFIEGQWWVTGSASGRDTLNYFYRFDRNGERIDSLTLLQPVFNRYGIHELDYYDGYIYGLSQNVDSLIRIDPETDEEVLYLPFADERINSLRNIVINPMNGHIFACGISNYLYELEIVDDTLVTVNQFNAPNDPRDDVYIRRYGLAWFRDDPDECNLYIMSNKDIDSNAEIPDISIFKMNPETEEVFYLTNLGYLDRYFKGRGGICITPRWHNMVWVMAAVLDNSNGDHIGIFELGPNASWVDYEPRSDTLYAEEAQDIILSLKTTDLDTGRYSVIIEFFHNAVQWMDTVSITLDVSWNTAPIVEQIQPVKFGLDQNYPNPFNSVTRISYAIERASEVNLTICDITGRIIKTLVSEEQSVGRHVVTFNAAALPSGLYFYRLEAYGRIAMRKMVLIR